MASKSEQTNNSVLHWLYERGEERLAQAVQELAKNTALTSAVTKGIRRAAQTKGRMDQNMQTFLSLLNLPSRADYQKLLTKLETLQGSLINVNMKLDRLMAAAEKRKRAARKAPHSGSSHTPEP